MSTAKLNFYTIILYTLCVAVEILRNRVEQIMTKEGYTFHKDAKKYIMKYVSELKEAQKWYDKGIETHVMAVGEIDGWIEGYDRIRSDANELLRLIFKFCKKSARNPENMHKIFRFIDRVTKKDQLEYIEDSDVNYFNVNPR